MISGALPKAASANSAKLEANVQHPSSSHTKRKSATAKPSAHMESTDIGTKSVPLQITEG